MGTRPPKRLSQRDSSTLPGGFNLNAEVKRSSSFVLENRRGPRLDELTAQGSCRKVSLISQRKSQRKRLRQVMVTQYRYVIDNPESSALSGRSAPMGCVPQG